MCRSHPLLNLQLAVIHSSKRTAQYSSTASKSAKLSQTHMVSLLYCTCTKQYMLRLMHFLFWQNCELTLFPISSLPSFTTEIHLLSQQHFYIHDSESMYLLLELNFNWQSPFASPFAPIDASLNRTPPFAGCRGMTWCSFGFTAQHMSLTSYSLVL